MPTYQYACTECGHDFEAVQSFSDASLTECPVCAGRLRKVFGAVGIVFKGSGFYRTDSRDTKKTSDTPAKVDAKSGSSDGSTKPAAKDGGSSSSSSTSAGSSSSGSSSSGSSSSGSSGSSPAATSSSSSTTGSAA